MASVVSKNSPPARHEDGVAAPPALDKDAVLRRIRHRRRANRLRESLQSLLLTQQAAAPPPPPPETADKDGERLAWLDDAFSSP
ncbi:uncharacterized protein LOC102713148 [Oryza brachyantha]|uniref:uncharacterized protein LOC102713148 n=1 Tax=Oryza brachyantha TaxID=4533 RepID=UPI001ADC41B8|nr:uncharacterized protein LOC102713148 [Oryza brachyantha]